MFLAQLASIGNYSFIPENELTNYPTCSCFWSRTTGGKKYLEFIWRIGFFISFACFWYCNTQTCHWATGIFCTCVRFTQFSYVSWNDMSHQENMWQTRMVDWSFHHSKSTKGVVQWVGLYNLNQTPSPNQELSCPKPGHKSRKIFLYGRKCCMKQ